MKNRKFAALQSPKLGDVPIGLGAPQLNPEIQAKIGQQLSKIYEGMVKQGIPDRFRNLLDRLEQPQKSDREPQ
jgi:hypothetical protein